MKITKAIIFTILSAIFGYSALNKIDPLKNHVIATEEGSDEIADAPTNVELG